MAVFILHSEYLTIFIRGLISGSFFFFSAKYTKYENNSPLLGRDILIQTQRLFKGPITLLKLSHHIIKRHVLALTSIIRLKLVCAEWDNLSRLDICIVLNLLFGFCVNSIVLDPAYLLTIS